MRKYRNIIINRIYQQIPITSFTSEVTLETELLNNIPYVHVTHKTSDGEETAKRFITMRSSEKLFGITYIGKQRANNIIDELAEDYRCIHIKVKILRGF